MRSALICVFFLLLINGHVADDFRPTPIPLDEWHFDRIHGRAGTLHETIKTSSPLTVVAIPAHYWEDALRHSVYLTLVRDKIDQLIAKGDVISPDTKFNHRGAKDIDDQDLWDKIKAAPFDRIREEEPTSYGDVTILARGRLMEESGGFRFAEDDKSQEKCDNDKCMDGVKAFWSVKRVRQRDQETSLGKYHYELTFSVMSQIPKTQKKPYEHPIRTFTVQESTTDRVVQPYQRYHKSEIVSPQISRPERAIWIHKNIEQAPQYRRIQHQSGLDRLFSSLFDYDDDDEPSYDPPRRYKQNSFNPTYSQYSKIGSIGSSEQHSQIKTLPYPYKLQNVKYQESSLTTSSIGLVQHHHTEQDISGGISKPYLSHTNYKIAGFIDGQRTTHTAFLPTPLPPLAQPPKESNNKKNNFIKYDSWENKTNPPEILTVPKQNSQNKIPAKVSYSPEHVRPPIYNAPPGVFVTLDKKPFKPMPPLKMPPSKSFRPKKPLDFRPSPQVLDVEFSEPDPLFDTVFRPITVNYTDNNYSKKKTLIAEANEKDENKIRKPTVIRNKNPKKHDDIKIQRTTTYTPDIITAHNNSEQDDDMAWADILGIFSKTIPMESQKEKSDTSQTTTPIPSPTTVNASASTSKMTFKTSSTTTLTTTLKPKKRTRQPIKSNKSEKIKKHKRLTTTSTSTTTNTPLTTKIFAEAKEKTTEDLISQASSTAIGPIKFKWQPSSKTTSTTPISSTGTTTTVSPPATTKIIKTTTTNVDGESVSSTARSRNINRFRQSTLILKGTSVKHDRWSATKSTPERLRSSLTSSIYTKRRKGSNFEGYDSSTPKSVDKERRDQSHLNHGTSTKSYPITKYLTKKTEVTSNITPVNEGSDVILMENEDESNKNEEKNLVFEESRDQNEYIFEKSSDTPNNKNNEIIDNEETLATDKIASTPSYFIPKAKKCKKKHQNLATKEDNKNSYEINNDLTTTSIPTTPFTTTTTIATTTTTTKPLTTSIVEDLLKDFSFENTNNTESLTTTLKSDLNKEQSQSKKQNLKIDEEFEEFLDSLNSNDKYSELSGEEYEEDNEKESTFEEEDTSFELADESRRHSPDDYEDNEKHPLTLLELMAME